jgi:hypothetical protein
MTSFRSSLLLLVLAWPLSTTPAAAEPLLFSARKDSAVPLSIARFGPEAIDSSLALSTPQQQWSTRALDLELDVGGELECGTKAGITVGINAAITAPNRSSLPPAEAESCQFSAVLTVTTAVEPVRIEAHCAPWMDDVSWCTVEDAGQFWVQRPLVSGTLPKVLTLVFGHPPLGAPSAPLETGSASTDGIILGPPDDLVDSQGMPTSYLWLVWPPGGTTLVLYR